MVLFWIIVSIVGLNVFLNFVLMFGATKGSDRAANAVAFLMNVAILGYVIFGSTPK